jgi:quinate/shikimate dehydrogenase (NAD+)
MTVDFAKPTVLCGLIGQGIQASLTPAMHMQEGEAQGLRSVYRLIDLTVLGLEANALPELLTAAQRMGFSGLNITFPCKQSVIPHLDDMSEEARALGAVNTVVLRGGKRVGYNTDCSGYGEAFRAKMSDAKKDRVVQMGAGGAAAAVAFALLSCGVGQLTIFDIEPGRAGDLAAKMSVAFRRGPPRARQGYRSRRKERGRPREHDARRDGEAPGHADNTGGTAPGPLGLGDHLFPT